MSAPLVLAQKNRRKHPHTWSDIRRTRPHTLAGDKVCVAEADMKGYSVSTTYHLELRLHRGSRGILLALLWHQGDPSQRLSSQKYWISWSLEAGEAWMHCCQRGPGLEQQLAALMVAAVAAWPLLPACLQGLTSYNDDHQPPETSI